MQISPGLPETSSCATRADTPGELQELWNSAKPVPQPHPLCVQSNDLSSAFPEYKPICGSAAASILARNFDPAKPQPSDFRRILTEHLQACDRETRNFAARKLNYVRTLLDSQLPPDVSPREGSYMDFRLPPYRHSERTFSSKCAKTVKWMQDVDHYVVAAYNGSDFDDFDKDDDRGIRFRLDTLSQVCAPSVITLIIGRIVGFCKVCTELLKL